MKKIVINSCYGGFSLSEAAYAELGMSWDKFGYAFRRDGRDSPQLVAAVEKLGSEAASGRFAELRVVELDDEVEWHLQEYDGKESIHEDHRSWGGTCE